MSEDDVHPGEMDTPHEFDDETAEALLAGNGDVTEPEVADFLGSLQPAYVSQPPAICAALAAILAEDAAPTTSPSASRRFERMRSSLIAKCAAASAALVPAT